MSFPATFTLAALPAVSHQDMADLMRLILAAALGAIIGVERELKHRPAGLRTILFITFGAALFTILSVRLAGPDVPDRTRIAAQIITGIGFIGAGSILHEKGSVSGLTSAAAIFVAAGIGMAAGGGFYWTAIFSTLITLICLLLLGQLEGRFNLKPITVSYDVISTGCEAPEELVAKVNSILDREALHMESVQIGKTDGQHCRVQFDVEGYRSKQTALAQQIRALPQVMVMAKTVLVEHD